MSAKHLAYAPFLLEHHQVSFHVKKSTLMGPIVCKHPFRTYKRHWGLPPRTSSTDSALQKCVWIRAGNPLGISTWVNGFLQTRLCLLLFVTHQMLRLYVHEDMLEKPTTKKNNLFVITAQCPISVN